MEATDWLSRLLEIVPVSGAVDVRCLFGAPWRIDYAPSKPGEIPYHVVLSGTAMLRDSAAAPSKLMAGDMVLLPHASAHILYDDSGADPSEIRVRRTLNIVYNENDGIGERLDMLCGRFVLSPEHERLIRSYLPQRLVVRAPENSAGSEVVGLIGLLRVESAAESLGGLAMLNAFSTALFAIAIRLASQSAAPPEGLLALAANPRLAPALTAMFNEPSRPWTLPELAQRCNMSRATFIRHFQAALGRSPIDLLGDIRMTVAANALRTSDMSTMAIAELAGYQSEAAFQRAFKQHVGITPAQWRRLGRTTNQATEETAAQAK